MVFIHKVSVKADLGKVVLVQVFLIDVVLIHVGLIQICLVFISLEIGMVGLDMKECSHENKDMKIDHSLKSTCQSYNQRVVGWMVALDWLVVEPEVEEEELVPLHKCR